MRARLRLAKSAGKRLGRPRTAVDAKQVGTLRAVGASWEVISRELGTGGTYTLLPHSSYQLLKNTGIRSGPGKSSLLRGQSQFTFFDRSQNPDSAISITQNKNAVKGIVSDAANDLPSPLPAVQGRGSTLQSGLHSRESTERIQMYRALLNLIAVVERSEHGFADLPPSSINDDLESQLAELGYAVALSDRLYLGGYRLHSPESVLAGNYRPHVPPSNFTCIASRSIRVPEARDFDLEAILEERGELPSN